MPRKQLTQAVVEKLRADPQKVIEQPDHLYPALRLVVQPSGSRAFAVRCRIGGRTAKITLKDVGLDLGEARKATRKVLEEIAAGRDPREGKRKLKATTLGGVAELYLKDAESGTRPRTQVERVRHLRRDWAPLHHRPLAEIRKAEIAGRLLEIKQQFGPIAANRSRTTLHALFQWAMGHDLIEANVVASTRRPLAREATRSRVLSLEELRAIWGATEGEGGYNCIVRLLALLGQRREEVGGMRWAELDLDRALWSLPPERTKNGLPHVIPLSRQAVELIKAQPRRGDFVFGADGAAPFSGWSRCKRRLDRRCGVTNWVLHDLRRSLVTHMNDELGIQPHVVEAVINHVSGESRRGVAGVYNRAAYIAERTAALQAWADVLTSTPSEKVVQIRQGAA